LQVIAGGTVEAPPPELLFAGSQCAGRRAKLQFLQSDRQISPEFTSF
jgi:hypothetical protein